MPYRWRESSLQETYRELFGKPDNRRFAIFIPPQFGKVAIADEADDTREIDSDGTAGDVARSGGAHDRRRPSPEEPTRYPRGGLTTDTTKPLNPKLIG